MRDQINNRGFTLIEILVVMIIMVVLFGISTQAFINAKRSSEINTLTDAIVSKLEQAKINATFGKNGTGAGIDFGSTTYTYFVGNSFNPSATTNENYAVTNGYMIATTPNSLGSVVFARLSGIPQTMATITIQYITDPSRVKNIFIGSQGDINIIK
jgi:prepilin-type N-terminal cleavage/methylation domain-containing protein